MSPAGMKGDAAGSRGGRNPVQRATFAAARDDAGPPTWADCYFSSSIGLKSTPTPSMSISQVSPCFIHTGFGLRAWPTPDGVPVKTMSPGSSVMPWRDVGDGLGDRKHHVIGIVGLHDLAVEPGLDLQALAARRHLVGGDHPWAEAAGAIEVLAHVPLRGLALKFAHRAFVAAGISGDAGIGVLEREMLGALADDENELGLVVERLGHLRPDDRLTVRHERGGCRA